MSKFNPENLHCDIAVIGAGASGMTAAICAARMHRKVYVFESGERAGKKILSTGNGKCNLSHTGISSKDYYGSGADRADAFLEIFGTGETLGFFKSLGLLTRTRDGYIYPYSETAQSVLDALRFGVEQSGAKLLSSSKITDITKRKDVFALTSADGSIYTADKVIVCTGGKAAPGTGSDGNGYQLLRNFELKIVKPEPALCRIISGEKFCRAIDGVRAKGRIGLYVNDDLKFEEAGEIQFTKDGLSGIPVFNMARLVSGACSEKKKITAIIDLAPDFSEEELFTFYMNKKAGSLSAEEYLGGLLNKKITLAVMKLAGINAGTGAAAVKPETLKRFCSVIKAFKFDITGAYGFESAQVTAGGIHFDEVDENLECKKVPGLFLAGEILDIDGKCGGYNLQWAWTSGYIAGIGALK